MRHYHGKLYISGHGTLYILGHAWDTTFQAVGHCISGHGTLHFSTAFQAVGRYISAGRGTLHFSTAFQVMGRYISALHFRPWDTAFHFRPWDAAFQAMGHYTFQATGHCSSAIHFRTAFQVMGHYTLSARNKASRSTGHLVAISLTQGLLVHLCPDK